MVLWLRIWPERSRPMSWAFRSRATTFSSSSVWQVILFWVHVIATTIAIGFIFFSKKETVNILTVTSLSHFIILFLFIVGNREPYLLFGKEDKLLKFLQAWIFITMETKEVMPFGMFLSNKRMKYIQSTHQWIWRTKHTANYFQNYSAVLIPKKLHSNC